MATTLDTIQQIYAAFGRGDIAFIMAALDDDVKWEAWEDNHAQAAQVPWLVGGRGKAAAGAFFQVVGTMRIHDFRVLGMLSSERQVAVEVLIDATLAHGQRLRDEELHLWDLDAAGRVVRMRHYVDTAKHIAAARGGH